MYSCDIYITEPLCSSLHMHIQHTSSTYKTLLYSFIFFQKSMARSFGLDEIQVQNNILRRFTHIHMNSIVGYSSCGWYCVAVYHYRAYTQSPLPKCMYDETCICMRGLVGWLAPHCYSSPISTRLERAHKHHPIRRSFSFSLILCQRYSADSFISSVYMAARRRAFWLL